MSKALESALDAVRRMSAGSEVDPAVWEAWREEMLREVQAPKVGVTPIHNNDK